MAYSERKIDVCEDCKGRIAMTDVEGHYSGVCASCRKKRGQSPYQAENWGMYGTANYGGHWRYTKPEHDTKEEHLKKWVKARDEGRLGN